jgi:hypothetical protein
MSETPETDVEVMLCHGIPDGFNPPELSYVSSKFARKLERDRDEARKAFVIATDQVVIAQSKTREAIKAILETLEENRHLADGDDCTLRKLKAIVPDWK